MKLSAKYDTLHPPLVERILAEESHKKDPVKAAKTRLHQLYGAYVQGNAHKKAAALLDNIRGAGGGVVCDNGGPLKDTAAAILRLHASTNERLPYFAAFYEFVARHTGGVKKITDLGCGFNPFSIPLMPAELAGGLEVCHAYDIGTQTKDLLNRFFSLLGMPPAAACADLALQTPSEEADLAILSKLLPVLEAQKPGRGYALARETAARFLVITFPLKSLGGREKGMARNYSAAFEKALADGSLHNRRLLAHRRVGGELVYVLEAL